MNRDTSKRRKLEALRGEILSRLPDSWFFPTEGNVQGFMGTGPVMFVAERPSTRKGFSGPGKSLLYPLLEETGNANGHVTDVIKTHGKAGQPYPDDMHIHWQFLHREIDIVQPHLIIVFGQKAYDLLQFPLAGCGITIQRVWHYSHAARGRDKQAEFKRRFRQVLGAMTRNRALAPGW